jgi:hypothetical protein
MERLVILLEHSADFAAPLLTRAALDAVCARHDITLAGICVRRPKSHPRLVWRHLQNGWRLRFRRWWGNQADPGHRQPWPLDLHRTARRADCRVLTPPHHDLTRARTPRFQAADGVWLRAVRLRRLKHFKAP